MPPASIEDEDNEGENLSDDSSDIVTSGNQVSKCTTEFFFSSQKWASGQVSGQSGQAISFFFTDGGLQKIQIVQQGG